MRGVVLVALVLACTSVSALYSSNDDVVILTPDNFKEEVLNYDGVVLVEFYAPWCGHCRNLSPEWKKAASALKGIAKVAAVDADQHKELGGKYSVQGFPTIKVFGTDKKRPSEYNGGRTAGDLIDAAIRELGSLAKTRAGLKKAKGSSSSSKKARAESGSGSGSKGGKSAVVELTADNFEETVLNSDDVWLVEFFAPWCGHCQRLAPEWEKAAKELEGKAKLGAVDATIHNALANKYGVRGYPTIKVFKGGPKAGDPVDYDSGRTSDAIVKYALALAQENAPAPEVVELTSSDVLNENCGKTSLCLMTWLPHILDSKASGREQYLSTLRAVAKKFKGRPIAYVWAEAGKQQALADALDIGGSGYPAVAVVNVKKGRYAPHIGSVTEEALGSFLRDVLSGRIKTQKVPGGSLPAVEATEAWDGKDGVLPKDDL